MKHRRRFVEARIKLRQDHPERSIPDDWFRAGRILADKRPIMNPRALIPIATHLSIVDPAILRGTRKLAAALDELLIDVNDRVCLDLGASAGGFTEALLARGARHVYAVDAGHGQLMGRLRQNPRVSNLERINLGELTRELVPVAVDLLTADLSYLSLSAAIAQLGAIAFSEGAELVVLVKPQFELGLASAPTTHAEHLRAVGAAMHGLARSGWFPRDAMRSPRPGANGAIEYFVTAVRSLRG